MFRLVICMTVLVFGINASFAHGDEHHHMHKKAGKKHSIGAVKEATAPMPLMMPIIKKNKATLGLTDQQMEKITVWHDQNSPFIKERVAKIKAQKKLIREASLRGEQIETVQTLVKQRMELQVQVVGKVQECINNIKEVLSKKQWEQLVGLYNKAN